MQEFLKFYDEIKKYNHRGWVLEVYQSDVIDWHVTVGYNSAHPSHGPEFQFGIAEETKSKALNKLRDKIGKDANKWKFEVRKLPLDQGDNVNRFALK